MNYTQQAIDLAMNNGYNPMSYTTRLEIDAAAMHLKAGNTTPTEKLQRNLLNAMLLDKQFWISLSKGLGNKSITIPKMYWLGCIQYLDEEHTVKKGDFEVEGYFKRLIKNPTYSK